MAIVFTGPFEYDDNHILALRAMTMVLESRLFDSIRQELGGTYSIGAVPTTQKLPRPMYSVRIEWACDPARTATLVQRVFQEIELMRDSTYSSSQMSRIRTALQRQYEQNSQSNSYVLGEIARAYQYGSEGDVVAALNMRDRITALDASAVQQAARMYLDMRNYVKVTLMPEAN